MRDYNIEDTAKLMTEAASGSRRKKMILIAAAVLAVIVIAVISIRSIGDKKYNDQIAIAEAALAEGKYEQAEAEYLKAVDMKGRKPKAREGLAYTYALEEKYEESRQTYQELYDDTQDEQYRRAAEDVSDGRLPVIDELFPSENIWLDISQDRLTEADDLLWFLEQYLSYYDYYSLIDERSRGEWIEDYVYDSEDPGNSYALLTAHALIDEGKYPDYLEAFEWNPEGGDPRGWADEFDQRIRKDVLDEVFADLFNADEDGIGEAAASMEELGRLYQENDYYYQFDIPMDLYPVEAEPLKVQINGSRCCIEYRAVMKPFDHEEEAGTVLGTYYAVMKLREINGGMHWTMISNGPEKPDYVSQPQKAEGGKSVDQEAVNKAYAEILEEHEYGIRLYYWEGMTDGYNVAFIDINGDGIEEMLYLEREEEYGSAELHIWSYDPESAGAVECDYHYNNGFMMNDDSDQTTFFDMAAGAGTTYMIYTGPEPGTMYIADRNADMFEYYRISCFRMNSPYEMEEVSCVEEYVDPIFDGDSYTGNDITFRIDGKEVSEEEGEAKFEEDNSQYTTLIMGRGDFDTFSVFRRMGDDTPLAMYYDEAISSLEN